jgi:transmembrane sensor
MDTSSKYTIPWDLIAGSFTGSLSDEEKQGLDQWLLSDSVNNEKYLQLQELWKSGMEDYPDYLKADGLKGWNALQTKLVKGKKTESVGAGIADRRIAQNPRMIRNLLAIAAIFLAVIGIGIWFMISRSHPVIYETAENSPQKVLLKDGSSIVLNPHTKITVSGEYNKSNRTVAMASGEAYFDVGHHQDKPFIVEMGATKIEDIGTSFTIRKTEKEIEVTVVSGEVAFVKLNTKETRQLTAGKSITYHVQDDRFGEIMSSSALERSDEQLLNFENTSLSAVILSIQKVYKKKVILNGSDIATKKITARLGGMPFETAMKVICKSMGLEYSLTDSVYLVTEKK